MFTKVIMINLAVIKMLLQIKALDIIFRLEILCLFCEKDVKFLNIKGIFILLKGSYI